MSASPGREQAAAFVRLDRVVGTVSARLPPPLRGAGDQPAPTPYPRLSVIQRVAAAREVTTSVSVRSCGE